jgi:hypothetical protein
MIHALPSAHYDLIRLLTHVHARRAASAFPSRPGMSPGADEISQVPRKELLNVHKVSDCARFYHPSQYAMGDIAFSSAERDRHLGIRPVSQLNTWPTVSPVNASRRPRGTPRITRGWDGWTFPMVDFHLLFFASFAWRAPLRVRCRRADEARDRGRFTPDNGRLCCNVAVGRSGPTEVTAAGDGLQSMRCKASPKTRSNLLRESTDDVSRLPLNSWPCSDMKSTNIRT